MTGFPGSGKTSELNAETLDLLTGACGPDDRLLIPTRPAWPALFNGGPPPEAAAVLLAALA